MSVTHGTLLLLLCLLVSFDLIHGEWRQCLFFELDRDVGERGQVMGKLASQRSKGTVED